ncbi:DNA-binding transcriptional regulator, LysR family [Cupriavidus necator]|uniref:LysR family transcriptional regulator n=1 Tax=Cupriavidus necator (strain ATCC 17699 / DSM 428 / KCTC 22496 / NCIMB 10442 / H16 / Stanier 337) TaxID=381666 RepID=Q0K6W3_CUPNH|nr:MULTISPECIES: LysR family transcriptional regulator [Cupriavidus]EON17625.1 LysR family transcriptional regulator [Cupriavidus sp. GA3-3]KUE85897.1 LysR family transcriptional regulator [Cupriavidus necator]QCC02018.1 LysR family transcriptional regulator [Cupriavidus necator H16]QQB75151.1 LysR family transcriptional regulator [Cupriavidus necator]WKA40419.1 LysR family transcriptional regulator [Cupriavidus necator]
MRGFETDQLRTFVTVADSGSLSAAAPRLFLSQSSVSEQLRKLEERAGVPLLSRGRHGAVPTPAGERLLEHARRILALNELALQDLRGHALAGELRLAVTDYFRPGEIAGMLRRLRERYPYLRLHVTVMKSAAIDAAAEMDTFDIGLSMRLPGTRGQGTRGTVLRREPLAWVAAPAEADSLSATLPLVLLPDTCSLHQYVVQLLLRKRLPFEIAHSASGVAGLHLALAAGLGMSCLNASAIGPGVAPLDAATIARLGLPRLPEAEFFLLPARRGESAFVAEARDALAGQLG